MMKTAIIKSLLTAATLTVASVAIAVPVNHTFTTQLEEVRMGHFDGTDYLTVQISGNVGPASCRGNVLKVAISAMGKDQRQLAIETVALSAMLNDDDVMITVGLNRSDCVDGKPALVDLHILN